MNFMIWSAAIVICVAVQVSSQLPPKPIGEWYPERYEMYPNPWVNSSACHTPETSGLCDYNQILTFDERKDLIEQPELKKVSDADGCLCNKGCAQIGIKVTVAIMKEIGPQITDYRAAAKDFAGKFRPAWNLTGCNVILIASNVNKMCFLDAGSDVNDLLSANKTTQIDVEINEYCSNRSFVNGINATLIKYRKALAAASAAAEAEAAAAAQTTAPTPALTPESEANGGSSAIIVGIIVGVLVVVIVVIIIIIIVIKRKRSLEEITTPKPLPHGGKAKEEEHLNSTPEDV